MVKQKMKAVAAAAVMKRDVGIAGEPSWLGPMKETTGASQASSCTCHATIDHHELVDQMQQRTTHQRQQ